VGVARIDNPSQTHHSNPQFGKPTILQKISPLVKISLIGACRGKFHGFKGILRADALRLRAARARMRYYSHPSQFSVVPIVSIEAIREFIAGDMQAIDRVIRSRLHSDVPLIRQVAEYIIGGGGKRLRPSLVVLSAGAFGYQGIRHHELAAVIEFIHTATLLHDDVVDESALRRGQATANSLFGNAASVLVGDFVYSRAFQMMVEAGSMRILEVLAEATNIIAEGEVLQLMNCHNPDIEEEGYLQVIRCKTAKLFEAATRIGALLGGASQQAEAAMARYGAHLGTAFQLIDDVLDYSGDHTVIGKNVGDDLAEGKPTLPLIHAMRTGTEAQVAAVRRAIEAGGLDELPAVLEAIRDTGALDYARERARAEAQLARDELEGLADTRQREFLIQLADFSVTRNY
jgi:octaprenyl-diphosphate synthase